VRRRKREERTIGRGSEEVRLCGCSEKEEEGGEDNATATRL
jgi:hypothetical protein